MKKPAKAIKERKFSLLFSLWLGVNGHLMVNVFVCGTFDLFDVF